MLYGLRDRLRRQLFALQAGAILRTPPLARAGDGGAVVLSQLQHKDVLMYLAAIKSFARWVPVVRVVVVNDGSLRQADLSLLTQHVPGIEFLSLEQCQDPYLPKGGTWERLIAIARLSKDHYVIQLDADTFSLGELSEVRQACVHGRAFTIGTWDDQRIEPSSKSADRARRAQARGIRHVQIMAEASLDNMGAEQPNFYVRGCSGFAGFAPGGDKLERMRVWSGRLNALLGDLWNQWGSEQVMSNLLVANHPTAVVLPHPDYADCEKMVVGRTRFVHFIGTCRFRGGVYGGMVREMAGAARCKRSY